MNPDFYHRDDEAAFGPVGAQYALVFIRFLTRRKVLRINEECERLREKMLEQKRLHINRSDLAL